MRLEEWQKRNNYIPLTYLEAKAHKPLIIKINEKFNLVVYPQSALTFATILDAKDSILENILTWAKKRPRKEDTKKEKAENYIKAIMALINILYELSHQEYTKDKIKDQYRRALFDFGIRNTDEMIEVWCRVVEANSRIEKKNVVPPEIQSRTNTRPLDKWRGFLSRKNIENKTFIEVLHEDEEEITRAIQKYRDDKERSKQNKSTSKKPF